jgi:hypothetical protein
MMYDSTFFLSMHWICTDFDLAVTIHSRFSWGFLPQVAQAKTRRTKIWFDAAGSMRSLHSIYHPGCSYADHIFFQEYSIRLNTYSPLLLLP